MSALFGIVGRRTGDLLTYGGRVIVHDNRAEMAYLFPNDRITEVRLGSDPMIPLVEHPDMAPIRFPLDRKDFRRGY